MTSDVGAGDGTGGASSTSPVHVIFVRNSVERLLPFLSSLLTNTDQRIRIVSNGCTESELHTLRAVRDRNPRAELVIESRDEVVQHGVLLERLLDTDTGEYFIFADSDVLATRTTSFAPLLPTGGDVARCSGLPLWLDESGTTAPPGFRVLGGRFLRVTDSDVVVGCSYIAAYRADRLRQLIRDWGVGLRMANWHELPQRVRAELDRQALRFDFYDTCKLANILLQVDGDIVGIVELPGLIHVGAQSGNLEQHLPRTFKTRILLTLKARMPWLAFVLWRARGFSSGESASLARLAAQRQAAVRFVDELADGLVSIDTAPEWCQDPVVFEALAEALQGRQVAADRA
jgi:hypothetical protein